MVNDFFNDSDLTLDRLAPMRGNEILNEVNEEKNDMESNIHKASSIHFVDGTSITMKPGEGKLLKVEADPFISNLEYLTFESSDLCIIRVIDGVAYAYCEGTVIVTCTTVDGLSASIEITVDDGNDEGTIDTDGEFIDPILPEEIIAGEEVSVTVGFTSETSFNKVKFVFTTEGPGDANYTISDGQGHDFSFTNNGDWGGSGFDIIAEPDKPYVAYTPVKVTFTEPGIYSMTTKLIYVDTEEVINESTTEVNVLEKKVGKFEYSFPQEAKMNEEIIGTVKFESESKVEKARFKFTTVTPENGIATYKMTDSLGQEFTFENDGFWGPENGFEIPAGYSASTEVKVTFNKEGMYTSKIELIDINNEEILNSDTVSINVL